ncbi:unnamed protein product, partial [Symbiodinium pilosum]
MALADVLKHHRETFWEHFRLDPCQYLTHASASHDAMLRMCCPREKRCLGLMTDSRIYQLTKHNIRGSLEHIAQLFAKANNSMLSDFEPQLDRFWILFCDVNSMYPSIMAKLLPVDGGEWIERPLGVGTLVLEVMERVVALVAELLGKQCGLNGSDVNE